MQFVPRDYQARAIDHVCAVPRCALHVGMGLGKTVSVLTALSLLRHVDVSRVLVLAPLRVASSVWKQEIEKWDHLRSLRSEVALALGTEAERVAAIRRDKFITVINYDNVKWLVNRYKDEWPWDAIVCDESSRLKSSRAARFKLLRRVLPKTTRWINMTGTPSPNSLIDLWSQFYLLDKGQRLGSSMYGFESRFFKPTGYKGYDLEPYDWTQEEIERRLADITLTLRAQDYLQLPPLIINDIYVDLPTAAQSVYARLERDMWIRLQEGEVMAANAAVLTSKCLQAASGALYVDQTTERWQVLHDAKLDALESIIEEMGGAPLLVAYHWQSDLVRLARRFPRLKTLDTKGSIIEAWNRGEVPLLAVHPASCGHGINLQDGGDTIVFLSHWWALEEYQQVIERIGPTRQAQSGRNRPVTVHHIYARGTIDELVRARRTTKAELQQLLLDRMADVSRAA